MGGCFGVPVPGPEDPAANNGQPPQPDAALPAANSLRRSIRDFFKKCLFSGWCSGGSDNLTHAELQRAKADIQRYQLESEELKSKVESMRRRLYEFNLNQFESRNPKSKVESMRRRLYEFNLNQFESRNPKSKVESMRRRLYEFNLNQFEFRNPRAVRGTGTDEKDEESSSSRTVKAWSMNREESSSSKTVRAWSLNRRLSG